MTSGTIPQNSTHEISSTSQFDSLSKQQDNSLSNIFEKALGWWKNVSQSIQHSNELRVEKMVDDSGYDLWYAYDPRTGKDLLAETDAEIINWIEDNYLGR